jgi:glucose-1-phosphate thymidylyltransferase
MRLGLMDALITAAGLGTRANLPKGMRKEMLPVYAVRSGKIVLRPVLECIIHNLSMSGADRFFVVLDSRDKHTEDYLSTLNMKSEFIYQKKPEGYGRAVALARDYITNDFILNAGDGLILDQEKTKNIIDLYKSKNETVLSLMSVSNPERYGVATIEKGTVVRVVEKPKNSESRYALAAFYVLKREIIELIDGQELTPAINRHIMNGNIIRPFKIRRTDWISIGNSDDYYRILTRTYNFCRKIISS